MQHALFRTLRAAAIATHACLIAALPSTALAQNAAAVSDGTAFAKSIAPTSSSQLVNPAGVNATTWAGNTGTPTAVPSSLGKFSTPNVSNTPYTSAKAIGLAGYGNQAVANCATYDPATGDATQSQTCAAINFLSNRCLSPTTQQGAIMAANATGATPLAANCAGTYGQAQTNYGYSEQETASDPIFTSVAGLGTTASATAGATCSTQTVVTTPAQYATNTCVKDDTTNEYTCYQYLNTTIETTYTPAQSTATCTSPAVLQNGFCVSQTSTPAPVIYGCPPGQTLEGDTCVSSTNSPANPTYTCPAGYTLSGSTCTLTSTATGVQATTCPDITITQGGMYGYRSGPFPGFPAINGYCAYYATVRDTNPPMDDCQRLIPSPPDGMRIFYAQFSVPAHGQTVKSDTCYLTPPVACPANYTWTGTVCQEIVTQNATVIGYNCPSGVVTGDQCVVTTTNPANPSFQCPDGTQLSGSNCVSTTQVPPNVSYSCPNGSAPVNQMCITNYVQASWVDTCGAYEGSANVTLPTPH